jgi:hypothetical protein
MSRLEKELARIEDHFRVCMIEYAHVFSPEGELLNYYRGTKDKVKFPAGRKLFNHILTHNHPSGGSFSARDLCLILEEGLLELRAYGVEGAYILRCIEAPRVHTLDPKFENKLVKIMKKNLAAIEEFADKFGFDYSFESAPEEFLEKSKIAADRKRGRR